MRRKNWWPPVFGVFLTAYAVFALLDAFVMPRDIVSLQTENDSALMAQEETAESELNTEQASENTDTADLTEQSVSEPVITDTSYQSENLSITITTLTRYDTQVYVADVVLQDASYLKTGLAENSFGRNLKATTSRMAEESQAILAINGDYYGFREEGYVMRGGYLYRDTAQSGNDHEDLVIYGDGSLEIVNESETDANVLAEAGAVEIFSFGPGLMIDGEISVSAGSEVDQAMQSNPRTAIGQIEPLHYVMVVSDGRSEESEGLTLLELAQVMEELGCQTAYNLDGGGSSTMWFMGRVINQPTDGWRDGERSVSDIVYIGE